MITLDFGITYIEGKNGLTYVEGNEMKVFLVTAYSESLNSIEHALAIASTHQAAMEGIDKELYQDSDYEAMACAALSDMLITLKKAIEK
jgi:hypothetical protein